MKKITIGLFSLILLLTPVQCFAEDIIIFDDGKTEKETLIIENNDILPIEEIQVFSDSLSSTSHVINVKWLLSPDGNFPSSPPFEGTVLIGSTSFIANEGDEIDISNYMYNPPGGSYWQQGFINYNGQPCYLAFTYGEGGNGINPYTGEYIDGLPFTFDPFSVLTIPGTDVDLYYIYIPYYEYIAPEESDLDKIVIYVNRPTGDINPVKQEYKAYEIFHVGKNDEVFEDVTNDYTVGQIMPTEGGFNYWILAEDPWFNVIYNSPYFILEQNGDSNYYNIYLNPEYPSTETTAIEIAHYLEDNIPENVTPKIITADTPSYDNDSGYYLIVSDLNSNLILGTTNIAITEKAEYPSIVKEVDDVNVEIGQIVTFTISSYFPKGSKAETFITDTMTEGLTYIDNSFTINVNDYQLDILTDENGWKCTIPNEVIKTLFKDDSGTINISYQALINEKAIIGLSNANNNTVRLDFSNFSTRSSVNIFLKNITLLKYRIGDDNMDPLSGAKFELHDINNNIIKLVAVEEGKIYRLATPNEVNTIDNFTTGASEITINGLASDETYYLKEIEAPPGYNILPNEVLIETDHISVGNSSGGVLPSTGGMGTTILYIIGSLMVSIGIIIIVLEKKKKD